MARRKSSSCERKYDFATQYLSREHSSESEEDDFLGLLSQEQMLKEPRKEAKFSKFAHPWVWDSSSETSEDSSDNDDNDKPLKIKRKDLQRARKKLKHKHIISSPFSTNHLLFNTQLVRISRRRSAC